MISAYSTPLEFKHAVTLSQATRVFVSISLLPLALTSGLPDDRIYVLEGRAERRLSYEDLVSRVRLNRIPRIPVKHATRDTLAYLVFSSGTSGLPKGVYLRFIFSSISNKPEIHPHHSSLNSCYDISWKLDEFTSPGQGCDRRG